MAELTTRGIIPRMLHSSPVPSPQPPAPSLSGFTLVELAVVLAIIGVLIGAILVGQNMLRSSQVQSVAADLVKYRDATLKFKDQYGGLPGDIIDATDYWGTDSVIGCTYTTSGTRVPRKETCNGNGDGTVVGTGNVESFRFWQQLANAGFIEGTYTGVAGSASAVASNTDASVGFNVPAAAISRTGFSFYYVASYSGSTSYYDGNYGNMLYYGRKYGTSFTYNAALTPREASMIDLKIDDGRPAVGNLRTGMSPINPNCTTTDVVSTAVYNVSYTGIACGFFYIVVPS